MNAHAGKWIPWIWGLLAVALLGGCSKDESLKSEPGSVPGPDRIEIRLSGGIALSDAGSKALASLPVTRAVVDANHEADLRVSFARIDQNGADGGWPSYTTASVLGSDLQRECGRRDQSYVDRVRRASVLPCPRDCTTARKLSVGIRRRRQPAESSLGRSTA